MASTVFGLHPEREGGGEFGRDPKKERKESGVANFTQFCSWSVCLTGSRMPLVSPQPREIPWHLTSAIPLIPYTQDLNFQNVSL